MTTSTLPRAALPIWAYALLALIAAALFLPGFTVLPPFDRDEARFAQASSQMLDSGNFIDIRFQDEARYKKPVGIYWLQTAATTLADAVRGVPVGGDLEYADEITLSRALQGRQSV